MMLFRPFFIFLCLFYLSSIAFAIEIKGGRIWSSPDKIRLVFDISAPLKKHRVFNLKNPNRVVIDLENTRLTGHFPKLNSKNRFIKVVRHASRKRRNYRIVLDLKQAVKPKSFLLRPNKKYGHRLVIDLIQNNPKRVKTTKRINRQQRRDIIIAIDAGHGGDDAGATGPTGAKEKKVVLQIAKKLQKMINQEKGLKAILIRKGDYYVDLRKRMELARKSRADLFISIHADAFKKASARGSSVYVVSKRGASNEIARWLAHSENNSDLVGGVKLDNKDSVLAGVLIDLSQSVAKEASFKVATAVYNAMKKINKMHASKVQKAGFIVLKSPDIPSILVETAFISNPIEEKNLRSRRHQKKIAKAIFSGIKKYFKANPPLETLWAVQKKFHYKVRSGDSLSKLALRYHVSQKAIKQLNHLKTNQLQIGQKIWIPNQ